MLISKIIKKTETNIYYLSILQYLNKYYIIYISYLYFNKY